MVFLIKHSNNSIFDFRDKVADSLVSSLVQPHIDRWCFRTHSKYKAYKVNFCDHSNFSRMSDRKAELERKKAKLAQIRAEKEARRKEREAMEVTSAAKTAVAGLKRDERQEIDRNLEQLGITPVAQVVDTI